MTWQRVMFFAALLLPTTSVVADDPYKPIVLQERRPQSWDKWSEISGADFAAIKDDDIQRHSGHAAYFAGIQIEEWYIRENGFGWHLLRFVNIAKPIGPLWIVPHDDENAAFEAALVALKEYGGVAVVVNSGPGSVRRQAGNGTCGVRADVVTSCDPNRNFADTSPKFTDAFLSQRPAGQPVIALHTNSPGFFGDGQGGRGDVTILDAAAFGRGEIQSRSDGHFAVNPAPEMANYDTLALTAYLSQGGEPGATAVACRNAMTNAGVHFWHERVIYSDGSMSNYLALQHPDIAYFNAESRVEVDLELAAARHKIMVAAYLHGCRNSGNKPFP
jgi:hypothetical protein